MCHIEIGNLAEWVAAIATVVTAVIAAMALSTWRDQLRGTSKHVAAAEILEAARLTKFHFYHARNPMYLTGEFPASYHQISGERSRNQEADGWAYLYTERWSVLSQQITRLATLRAKAATVLSEDCAEALEALVRKTRELRNIFRNRVSQIRAGPNVVAQWADQTWVERVKLSAGVIPGEPTDPYSLEFEARFTALKNLVDPFI